MTQVSTSLQREERLTREKWLARALDVLAEEGASRIRVSHLSKRLGVSTGSLYWHFRHREDLVKALVDYWDRLTMKRIIEPAERSDPDPAVRLLTLMRLVTEKEIGRYEVAVRAWATQEPEAAEVVRAVDERRYQYIRALFEGMGFSGEELEIRTRTFVAWLSLEMGILDRETKEERLRRLERRHEWFTTP